MGGRTGRRPMTVEIRQHCVACLKCGAQWWVDERGYETPGPPLFRYELMKGVGTLGKIRVRARETREPTRPCRCAQKYRVIDGPSQLVEHHIVPTHPKVPRDSNRREPDPVTKETVQPPPVIDLPLCVDGLDVGRIDLERGQLTQAIVDRATQYKPLSASDERKQRRLAEDRLRGLERVVPALAEWLMDVAFWDAEVEKLIPEGPGDPERFLTFLESHPDGIHLLGVPAVQRAIHWIRLECKKPDKERLGRWLGGTMKNHRPARLDHEWILRIYSRFKDDLDWALKFTQRGTDQDDDDDKAWEEVRRRCRGLWHRVQTAGLRRQFLQCAKKHDRRGGEGPLKSLTFRLVAHQAGMSPAYVRQLVRRGEKGEP